MQLDNLALISNYKKLVEIELSRISSALSRYIGKQYNSSSFLQRSLSLSYQMMSIFGGVSVRGIEQLHGFIVTWAMGRDVCNYIETRSLFRLCGYVDKLMNINDSEHLDLRNINRCRAHQDNVIPTPSAYIMKMSVFSRERAPLDWLAIMHYHISAVLDQYFNESVLVDGSLALPSFVDSTSDIDYMVPRCYVPAVHTLPRLINLDSQPRYAGSNADFTYDTGYVKFGEREIIWSSKPFSNSQVIRASFFPLGENPTVNIARISSKQTDKSIVFKMVAFVSNSAPVEVQSTHVLTFDLQCRDPHQILQRSVMQMVFQNTLNGVKSVRALHLLKRLNGGEMKKMVNNVVYATCFSQLFSAANELRRMTDNIKRDRHLFGPRFSGQEGRQKLVRLLSTFRYDEIAELWREWGSIRKGMKVRREVCHFNWDSVSQLCADGRRKFISDCIDSDDKHVRQASFMDDDDDDEKEEKVMDEHVCQSSGGNQSTTTCRVKPAQSEEDMLLLMDHFFKF